MNSSVLKNILVNKKEIPKFMIFIENEPSNAKAYLNLISKNIGKPIKFYDSADEALYDMSTGLVDDRIYYIVNDDKVLKNNRYISELKSFDENIIIGFDGMKIPDSFISDNQNVVYVFDTGSMQTLLNFIAKKAIENKITINQSQSEDLIYKSDFKLSQITNEIEKISLLDNKAEYIANQEYPNIAKIDNMSVMLQVLNQDKRSMQNMSILMESAVGSLKAIYTMAKKKFKTTDNLFYAKVMIASFKAYNHIIDGTLDSANSIKKFFIDIFA